MKGKAVATPSASNFDQYSENYDDVMRRALGRVGGESTYYLSQKAWLLRKLTFGTSFSTVVDFGSGIGSAVPFLKEELSPSRLFCVDESVDSLQVVAKKFPDVFTAQLGEISCESVDLVFVANVLHHIPVDSRLLVLEEVTSKLKIGGVLAVFEHNPHNPLTKRVVSSCEFDEGVDLLSSSELHRLVGKLKTMEVRKAGYCTFIPEPFQLARKLDWFLRRIPIGAQHYLVSERVS